MENNAKYMDKFVSKKMLLLHVIICMIKCESVAVDTNIREKL